MLSYMRRHEQSGSQGKHNKGDTKNGVFDR